MFGSWKVDSVVEKDNWDVWVQVTETSLFGTPTYRRFYGSGHTWYEIIKDRFGDDKEERCGGWTSGSLYDIWINYQNKLVEQKTIPK